MGAAFPAFPAGAAITPDFTESVRGCKSAFIDPEEWFPVKGHAEIMWSSIPRQGGALDFIVSRDGMSETRVAW